MIYVIKNSNSNDAIDRNIWDLSGSQLVNVFYDDIWY